VFGRWSVVSIVRGEFIGFNKIIPANLMCTLVIKSDR
jgi:hypothetical protein